MCVCKLALVSVRHDRHGLGESSCDLAQPVLSLHWSIFIASVIAAIGVGLNVGCELGLTLVAPIPSVLA